MDYYNGERSIQQFVAKQFAERMGPSFEIIYEYRDKGGNRQDIAILFNRTVVAFIECKRNARDFVQSPRVREWLNYLSRYEEARFYFVADKNECFLNNNGAPGFDSLSFDDAATAIKEEYAGVGGPPTVEEIADEMNEIARKLKIWKRLHHFIEGLRDGDITYSNTSPTYSFSTESEDELFLTLLGSINSKKFCRFTTLNSFFELLKEKKQNMCNIVCMNDRGEYRYADEYVYGTYPQLGSADFRELDDCFILSLLDREQEDDLTMWRLYGDNANGACIIYEAKPSILAGKDNQFFLGKVSYGKENGAHRELDFVKSLLSPLNKRGWYLDLKRWNIWKHFFKSHHFAVEKEVRLMYYDAPFPRSEQEYKWIKNPDSQIVSKMQMFELAKFPLKVDSARVGPKCQEADILARQFSIMGKGILPANFSVDPSGIKDYR